MSKSKTNKSTNGGVSTEQAALIHELLGECFEASLRQQLLAGEFNAAILGKVLEYLMHNNISVTEDADERLRSLATVFRDSSGSGHDFLSYLDGVGSREV